LIDEELSTRIKEVDSIAVSPLDLGYERIAKLAEQIEARERAIEQIELKKKVKKVAVPVSTTKITPVPKKFDSLVNSLKQMGYIVAIVTKSEDTSEIAITREGQKIRVYCVFDNKNSKLYVGETEITDLNKLETYFS
jgi:hypothetical protein